MPVPVLEVVDAPKRRNGFNCPLSLEQVAVWLLTALNIVHYAAGTNKHLEHDTGSVIAQLLTLVFLLLSFGTGFMTTKIDSEDEIIPIQK